MDTLTWGNSKEESRTDMEKRFGQMKLNTKVSSDREIKMGKAA